MDRESPDKLNLEKLRARLGEKPRTKAGQIRQAWPEIRALFEAGHSLKDIWIWLNEIGIEIGYARLSHYTGQLKRRDRAMTSVIQQSIPALQEEQIGSTTTAEAAESTDRSPSDPLANIRDRETRRPGFRYNAEPDPKKLI